MVLLDGSWPDRRWPNQILLMLVGFSAQDLQQWKNGMRDYEKDKRTKKPFGKGFSPSPLRVTDSAVKEQQRQFHPILQKYSHSHREDQARKHEEHKRDVEHYKHMKIASHKPRDYDIVNLHGAELKEPENNKVKAPLRNIYNPINNQPLPDFHFRNRDVRLPHSYNFKKISPEGRDFNIVTGEFHEDHGEKEANLIEKQNRKIQDKYQKSHVYDKIYGRYYDPHEQEEHQKQFAKSQLLHGSNYEDRFPPSYNNREPLILDREKAPTKSLIALDQRRAASKQRYQLKYILEEEYARRNIEHNDKKEAQLRNRVHNSHLLEMKAKEFDIVNLSRYEAGRTESQYGREAVGSTWERLPQKRAQSGIKSSGFA